jgi:GNAT superfamily N-acetyltransferase/ubiquinone/menaquinone biosynthesis C-methylase UbiE
VAVDPRDLDEAIELIFGARFGNGVLSANEAAAAEHLARRFDSGPELSQRLWGAGAEQREHIINYVRAEFRAGSSIGESPGFPKNRILSQLRAWYEAGPSEGLRGDPTYVARRLAVTESAFYMQALDNAVDEKLEAAGMIDGYEVLLAPEREEWDCDCRAVSEGGPYKTIAETPELPRHPNCMCRRRPIILGEKTAGLRAAERAARAQRALDMLKGYARQRLISAAQQYVEDFLIDVANVLRARITTTEEGILLQKMIRALVQHYTLLGKERLRMMFGRGPRVAGTASWPSPKPAPQLPAAIADAIDENVRLMQALAKEAHQVVPALPAPKVPKGYVTPDPAAYDASVRELLREAVRTAKPFQGYATYRPTEAAFKRWAEDDVIRSLFEGGTGKSFRVGPAELSTWQRGGKLKPTIPGSKPPKLKPIDPSAKPIAPGAGGAKPVVFRVWPVTAVEIEEILKPTGEGVLDDLQLGGSVVFPPGATLRPFAITEEDGEYVIEFREMPSWEAPAEFEDEDILRYVPPGLGVPDDQVIEAWRTLFPIPPDQLIEHLMFGIDAKVDSIGITASRIGDITIEVHTDKFTSKRRFSPGVDGVEVAHLNFNVKPEFQGQGIARAYLTNSVYLYEALGYRNVSTYASVSDKDIGGYTWARFGFKPLQYEWDRVRREKLQPWLDVHRVGIGPDAAQMLADVIADNDPTAIWRLAEHRLGLAIITGSGAGWAGTLDLADAQTMQRFNAYVQRLPLAFRAAEIDDLDFGAALQMSRPPRPPELQLIHDELAQMMHPVFDGPLGQIPPSEDALAAFRAIFFETSLSPLEFAEALRASLVAPTSPSWQVWAWRQAIDNADVSDLRVVFMDHKRLQGDAEQLTFALIDRSGETLALFTFSAAPPRSPEIVASVQIGHQVVSHYGVAAVARSLETFMGYLGDQAGPIEFIARDRETMLTGLRAGLAFHNPGGTSDWRDLLVRYVLRQGGERHLATVSEYISTRLISGLPDWLDLHIVHMELERATNLGLGTLLTEEEWQELFPRLYDTSRHADDATRLGPTRVGISLRIPTDETERTFVEMMSMGQRAQTPAGESERYVELRQRIADREVAGMRPAAAPTPAPAPSPPVPAPQPQPTPPSPPRPAQRTLAPGEEEPLPLFDDMGPIIYGERPTEDSLAWMRQQWGKQHDTAEQANRAFGLTGLDDEFVRHWEDGVGMTPTQFVEYFYAFAPPDLVGKYTWTVRADDDEIVWKLMTDGGHGVRVENMNRTVDRRANTVHHDLFVVGGSGKGLGKALQSASMDIYQHMGLDAVETTAGLSAGGYVWARFGFVPSEYGQAEQLADEFMEHITGTSDWWDHAEQLIKGDSVRLDEIRSEIEDAVMLDDGYRNRQGYEEVIQEAVDAGDEELAEQLRGEADDEIDKRYDQAVDELITDLQRDDTAKDEWLRERFDDEGLSDYPDPKVVWQIADHQQGRSFLAGQQYNAVLDMQDGDAMWRFDAYVGRGTPADAILDEAERVVGSTAVQYRVNRVNALGDTDANAQAVARHFEPITSGTARSFTHATPAHLDDAEYQYAFRLHETRARHDTAEEAHRAAVEMLEANAAVANISLIDTMARLLTLPGVPPGLQLTAQPEFVGMIRPAQRVSLGLGFNGVLSTPVPDEPGEFYRHGLGVGFEISAPLDAGQRTMRIALRAADPEPYGLTVQSVLEMVGGLYHPLAALPGRPGDRVILDLNLESVLPVEPTSLGNFGPVAAGFEEVAKAFKARTAALGSLFDFAAPLPDPSDLSGVRRALGSLLGRSGVLPDSEVAEAIRRGRTLPDQNDLETLRKAVEELRHAGEYDLLGRWLLSTSDLKLLVVDPKVARHRLPGADLPPFLDAGTAYIGGGVLSEVAENAAYLVGAPAGTIRRTALVGSDIVDDGYTVLVAADREVPADLPTAVTTIFNVDISGQEQAAAAALRNLISVRSADLSIVDSFKPGVVSAYARGGTATIELFLDPPVGDDWTTLTMIGSPVPQFARAEPVLMIDGPMFRDDSPEHVLEAAQVLIDVAQALDGTFPADFHFQDVPARGPLMAELMVALEGEVSDVTLANRVTDEILVVAKRVLDSGQFESAGAADIRRLVNSIERFPPADQAIPITRQERGRVWRNGVTGPATLAIFRQAIRNIYAEVGADGVRFNAKLDRLPHRQVERLMAVLRLAEQERTLLARPIRTIRIEDIRAEVRNFLGITPDLDAYPLVPELLSRALREPPSEGPAPVVQAFPQVRSSPPATAPKPPMQIYTTDEIRGLGGLGHLIDDLQQRAQIPVYAIDRLPPSSRADRGATINDLTRPVRRRFGLPALSPKEQRQLAHSTLPPTAHGMVTWRWSSVEHEADLLGVALVIEGMRQRSAWAPKDVTYDSRAEQSTMQRPVGRWVMEPSGVATATHELSHALLMKPLVRGMWHHGFVGSPDDVSPPETASEKRVYDALAEAIRRIEHAFEGLLDNPDYEVLRQRQSLFFPSDYAMWTAFEWAWSGKARNRMVSAINELFAEALTGMILDSTRFRAEYPELAGWTDALLEAAAQGLGYPEGRTIALPEPGAVLRAAMGTDYADTDPLVPGALTRALREPLFERPAPVVQAFPQVRAQPPAAPPKPPMRIYTTDEIRAEGLGPLIDLLQQTMRVPIVAIDRMPSQTMTPGEFTGIIRAQYGLPPLDPQLEQRMQRSNLATDIPATTYFTWDDATQQVTMHWISLNMEAMRRGSAGEAPMAWAPQGATYNDRGPAKPGSADPIGRWVVERSGVGSLVHETGHGLLTPVILRAMSQAGLIRGSRPRGATDPLEVEAVALVKDAIQRMAQSFDKGTNQAELQRRREEIFPSDYPFREMLTTLATNDMQRLIVAVSELFAEAFTGLALDKVRFRAEYPWLAAATERLLAITARNLGPGVAITLPEPGVVLRSAMGTDYPDVATPAPTIVTLQREMPIMAEKAPARAPPELRGRGLDFERFFSGLAGHFEQHINQSIPNYGPNLMATAKALARYLPKGATVIDVGASEGQFGAAIGHGTGGEVKVVNVDPNPNMRAVWERKHAAPGTSYEVAAWVEGFRDDENNLDVSAFTTRTKAHVIHMSMVRQFVTDDLDSWYSEVKRFLRRDGIFINNVKVVPGPTPEEKAEWTQRESQKDTYKLRSFSPSEITRKAEETLVGMHQLMATLEAEKAALRKLFKHVVVYWESYNFYGIVAGDDPRTIAAFLREHGVNYKPDYQAFQPATPNLGVTLERAPKPGEQPALYHGTGASAALGIEVDGLVPMVGDLTLSVYEDWPGEKFVPAVFFAKEDRLGIVITSMLYAVRLDMLAALGDEAPDWLQDQPPFMKRVSLDDVRRHGAIAISRSYDPEAIIQPTRTTRSRMINLAGVEVPGELPKQVEPRDLFALVGVPVDDVLTGDRLIQWLRDHMPVPVSATQSWRDFVDLGLPLDPDVGLEQDVVDVFTRMGLFDDGVALERRRRPLSAQEIADKIMAYVEGPGRGGATYSVAHDHFHEGAGFGVAVNKLFERVIPAGKFGGETVGAYIGEHPELFAKSDIFIGVWRDPASGGVYLDVSQVVYEEATAQKLSVERHQKAYWDFVRHTEVFVEQDGALAWRNRVGLPDLALFPLDLLPSPPTITAPPAAPRGELQLAHLAPIDTLTTADPAARTFGLDDEALTRVAADGMRQRGLLDVARYHLVGAKVPITVAPGQHLHAYVTNVPKARLHNADEPYESEVALAAAGFDGLYWPEKSAHPNRGQARLWKAQEVKLLGKLDAPTAEITGANLWDHVLDTAAYAASARVPIPMAVRWGEGGWEAPGAEAAIGHAHAAGRATLYATVEGPEEELMEAVKHFTLPDDHVGLFAPAPFATQLAAELAADARAFEAMGGAAKATNAERQAFAVTRAIERAGMAVPPGLSARPTGPGLYAHAAAPDARVVNLASLDRIEPRVMAQLQGRLQHYYSPQYLAAYLGFQAVDLGIGHAILDENAVPADAQSSACISGPTRTIERIRLANPDVEFRYVTYVPIKE